MIQQLDNGATLITLGEGTVLTGNVHASDNEKPFGIYFSNEKGKNDGSVIIALQDNKAVASYIMSLVRFLEAHAEADMTNLLDSIALLKKELEPLLPQPSTSNIPCD